MLFVNTLVVCVILILLELTLRATGYGSPDTRPDPFFGFPGTDSLFRIQDMPGQSPQYISASKEKSFQAASFPVNKQTNTYRIFALGGSTTRGSPYGNTSSFPFWLEQELRFRYPDRKFEVINLGISGFGSSRVLQILREVVHYDPDLIIVYTGQNEFRDALFHPYELRRSEQEAEILEYALRVRLLYLGRQVVMDVHAMCCGKQQITYAATKIARAVETPYSPDNFRSYDYFTVPALEVSTSSNKSRSSAVHSESRTQSNFASRLKGLIKRTFRLGWMVIREDEVYAIFARNIAQMMATAKRAEVPIVFFKKAINPKRRGLLSKKTYVIRAGEIDDDVLATWRILYKRAVNNLRNSEYPAALDDLQELEDLSVVDEDRLLKLYLGLAYEATGSFDKAAKLYESRLRKRHSRLNQILDEKAAEHNLPVIDAYHQLQKNSPTGIVDYNYFVDSVHMTSEGYKVLGTSLVAFIEDYTHLLPGPINHKDENPSTRPYLADTVSRPPNAHVQTTLAWSAFYQGDPDTAIRLATMAVEINPESLQAHLLLVYAYTRLGELGHAESSWRDLKQGYIKLESR